MFKNERGIIAIEMLISFVGFLLCIAFMVMWIYAATVQTRVHYALTQTAQELSFYSHALEIFGVSHGLRRMEEHVGETRNEINAVTGDFFGAWDAVQGTASNVNFNSFGNAVASIQVIGEGADAVVTHVDSAAEQIGAWADQPDDFFRGLMWVAASETARTGINALFGHAFIPSFFWRYMQMASPDITGQEYMRRMFATSNVDFTWWDWDLRLGTNIGLQGPQLFTGPYADEMTVSARYNLVFANEIWRLGDFAGLTVVQQVQARAWTGDGNWFRRDIISPTSPNRANRGVQ